MRLSTPIGLFCSGLVSCALLVACSSAHTEEGLAGTKAAAKEAPEAEDEKVAPSSEAAASADGEGTAGAVEMDSDTKPAAEPASDAPRDEATVTQATSSAGATTRAFFWGKATLTAPGFYVPPNSTLTIALDGDNRLRYLSVGDFSALPKTFGDGPKEFPLSGSKHVDLNPEYGQILDVTVDPASTASASHFLFRIRVVGGITGAPGITDYVESVEGHAQDGGWSVVYTEKGKLYAANIDARGEALLFAGDPQVRAPEQGQPSVWSAPVQVVAPGFVGPPVDHLKVALDGKGRLRSFAFHTFVRHEQLFGSGQGAFPLSGSATVNGLRVTVEESASSPDQLTLRYRVFGGVSDDYVEGLEATRQADKLVVRYSIKGRLWGASIDAHAAGTLVPSSEE